jgi:hypothetical protein
MANTFKNANDILATTNTEIYTSPALTTAIVIGSTFTNVDPVNPTNLTVYVEDLSASVTRTILSAVPIPVGGGYSLSDVGKLVLEAGDKIIGKSSVNNAIEATIHVLEIS